MIRIEIIDPQVLDEKQLVATARYLLNLAGHELGTMPARPRDVPLYRKEPESYSVGEMPLKQHIEAKINKELTPIAEEIARNINEETQPKIKVAELGSTIRYTGSPDIEETELDSEGKPWNAQTHSRTKSKTNDGKWRLKQRMNVANQPVVAPPPSVPKPPIEPVTVISVPRQGVLPKHEPREDGTKLYLPEHDVVIEKEELEEWRKPYEVTFDMIMKKITPLITKIVITNQEIFTIVQSFGIETLFKMSEREDLLPAFDDELNKLIEKNENERKK